MAYDKVVDSAQLDSTLTNIANSIRSKTGKSEPILTENMASEIDGISGGGVEISFDSKNSKALFQKAIFNPTEVKLTINNILTSIDNMFDSSNVTKVTLIGNQSGKAISAVSTFNSCTNLSTIDLTNFIFKPTQAVHWITSCSLLREVRGEIDFSAIENTNAMFNAGKVEYIRFKKETLSLSVDMFKMTKLNVESLQSIVDGLATVEAPQTLTLHPTVKAKLTSEQQQTITSKNWTVA